MASLVGVCAIAPLGTACSRDETPPEIVDARFEDLDTLIVTFSEPLAPVDDVDPASHFRIGVGFALSGQDQTVYYDLSNHFPYGVPGQGDLADQWQRHGLTHVGKLEPGDDPRELRLILTYPMELYTCEILAQAEALGIPSGLHLHYSDAVYPRITDEAGNPLASQGESWVTAGVTTTTVSGEFPELDPRMPIPCPDPG
jgi:hypothetical protein